MEHMRLGRTNLEVARSGFGALPIQRISIAEAGALLRKAYQQGINFFDTARMYSDSEEKIGMALGDVRHEIIIATKSHAQHAQDMRLHLETSLENLKTTYIDIYQFHNKSFVPQPGGEDGLYDAILEAKKAGKVRFIGITSHSLEVALRAVDSGLYDTVQFPLSAISSPDDLSLIERCQQADIGLIAMKALAGGLIHQGRVAFAFMRQYQNVLPIWGIQHEWELDEFIECEQHSPVLDSTMWQAIHDFRNTLAGSFCRGCGYCLPCPAGIPINNAARMSLLLRRAVYQNFLTDAWKEQMERIDNCINCGQCKSRCPYGLDTPSLLKENLKDYRQFYATHKA